MAGEGEGMGGRLRSLAAKAGGWRLAALCNVLMLGVVTGVVFLAGIARMNANDEVNVMEGNSLSAAAPDASANGVLVLMHVSDLHISIYDPSKEDAMREFCTDVVPSIKPKAVFATGDLVDGYDNIARRGGAQVEAEWVAYRSVLDETGMLDGSQNVTWLDTRGNHGTYGSGAESDPDTNLYEKYGAMAAAARGEDDRRSWRHDVPMDGGGVFRVVGLDASVGPGVAKPFQFFGYLSDAMKSAVLARLDEPASGGAAVQGKLLVGHHPDSSILNGLGSEIREKFPYYLCGHIHSAKMKQRLGTMLELEVNDFKQDKAWRLMALDNGQLSFSDHALGEWPVGLITNPKDARYLSEQEPFHATSSHVRVLAFTSADATVTAVRVSVDGGAATAAAPVAGQAGLFAAAWDPSTLAQGELHTVTAEVEDSEGRTSTLTHQFSLDGQVQPLERSSAQVSQSHGDGSVLFRAMLGTVAVFNTVLSWSALAQLRAAGAGPGQDKSAAGRRRSDTVVAALCLMAVLMLVLPFAVGFFVTSDGPLCFCFTFGIAVVGQGFAFDAQASLFGLVVQFGIVFPALLYFHARSSREERKLDATAGPARRSLRQLGRSLAGYGRLYHVSPHTPVSARARWGRVFAAYYFCFVLLAALPYLRSQVDDVAFFFLSPALWFLAAVLGLLAADLSKEPVPSDDGLLDHVEIGPLMD